MTHQHHKRVGTGYCHAALTLTCFDCRYTAKAEDGANEMDDRRCPHCRQPLVNCGKSFKPPRKDDDRGWRESERLFGRQQRGTT